MVGNLIEMQIQLTPEDIEQDIENFLTRIEQAKAKLANLPTGYFPYSEHKKREKQRRDLQTEIKHVENLIRIAQEGLNGHT